MQFHILLSKSQLKTINKALQQQNLTTTEKEEIVMISEMIQDLIDDTPPFGVSQKNYKPQDCIFDFSEY